METIVKQVLVDFEHCEKKIASSCGVLLVEVYVSHSKSIDFELADIFGDFIEFCFFEVFC